MGVRVALVGSQGFVGSAIEHELGRLDDVELISVTRSNFISASQNGRYDFLINTAMPSGRYWASKNPLEDFRESVQKTAWLVNDWNWDKFIQISSISARSQLDTVYGRHKAAAEKLCDPDRSLIIRLGPMYGDALSKGVLFDMVNNENVYVARESRYCFAPVNWVANWISRNLHTSGLIDLGGKEAICLAEVASAVGSNSKFYGKIDDQIVSAPIVDAPSATEVIKFALQLKSVHRCKTGAKSA